MHPVEYLLTATGAVILIGCWTLINSARYAVEGYEDEFGFHFGITPPVTSLYTVLAQAAFIPAELARAVVPMVPKGRRKSGSKPPMLPADLDVQSLNPRPAAETPQTRKTDKSQRN